MKEKLRLIFLPFLIINTAFAILYPALCWLLFVHLQIADPTEELVGLWLPFALAWIPVLLWLRPRIKLLQLNRSGRKSPDFGYQMIAAMAIAASAILSTKYMYTATGQLTTLQSINAIDRYAPTKYYATGNVYVDKARKGVYYTSEATGRNNSGRSLRIYIACPVYDKRMQLTREEDSIASGTNPIYNPQKLKQIFHLSKNKPLIILDGSVTDSSELNILSPDSIAAFEFIKGEAAIATYGKNAAGGALVIVSKKNSDAVAPPPAEALSPASKAWLCISYSKQISNQLSLNEKDDAETDFYNETLRNFEDSNLSSFSYLDRIGNNATRDHYRQAANKAPVVKNDDAIVILEPKLEPFEMRSNNTFPWIFGAFGTGSFVIALMVLIPKLDKEKYAIFRNNEEAAKRVF